MWIGFRGCPPCPQVQPADSEARADRWLELSEDTFLFANRAKKWFENGDLDQKRLILEIVGSHLILKDKKLLIKAKKPFLVFQEEPSVRTWWSVVEDVRTFCLMAQNDLVEFREKFQRLTELVAKAT